MKQRNASQYGKGHDDGLEPLVPLDIGSLDSVDALVSAMANTAFHPDAPQEILETDRDLLVLVRRSLDGRERVACCFNFSAKEVTIPLSLVSGQLGEATRYRSLLNGGELKMKGDSFLLGPYDCAWVVGE